MARAVRIFINLACFIAGYAAGQVDADRKGDRDVGDGWTAQGLRNLAHDRLEQWHESAARLVELEGRHEEVCESHDAWMHRAKEAEKALQVARGEEPQPIYPGDPPPEY